MENISPVSPAAPYIGGKRALAETLVKLINTIEHTGYAEAFVGMGGVFFRRTMRPKSETINDINGEISNLFRVLQAHYPQFISTMQYQITSRKEFERLLACDTKTLTDFQRAARFLYLQKLCFGGKPVGQNFGVDKTGGARFNLANIVPTLEDLHERLSSVVIENLSWDSFIPRYDHAGMLFYLDPPYFNCETDYGKNVFEQSDFQRIADMLATIDGQFIMSINDTPEIREIYSQFDIEAVKVPYTIAGGAPKDVGELIITSKNLKLRPDLQLL